MYEFDIPDTWNDPPLSIKIDEIVDPGRRVQCSFTQHVNGTTTYNLATLVTGNPNGAPGLALSAGGLYGALVKVNFKNRYTGDIKVIVTTAQASSPNEITVYVEVYRL